MISRTRTILRDHYIGAIVIALLWAEALRGVVEFIVGPIQMAVTRWLSQSNYRGVFDSGEQPQMLWLGLLKLFTAAVIFAIGYLLATWIYPKPADAPEADEAP